MPAVGPSDSPMSSAASRLLSASSMVIACTCVGVALSELTNSRWNVVVIGVPL
jgi:hypothetical protein